MQSMRCYRPFEKAVKATSWEAYFNASNCLFVDRYIDVGSGLQVDDENPSIAESNSEKKLRMAFAKNLRSVRQTPSCSRQGNPSKRRDIRCQKDAQRVNGWCTVPRFHQQIRNWKKSSKNSFQLFDSSTRVFTCCWFFWSASSPANDDFFCAIMVETFR